MKSPRPFNRLGATCALLGFIVSGATPASAALDLYALQFVSQVSAPRPVLTAEPAAYLFSDVNLEVVEPTPAPREVHERSAKKQAAARPASTPSYDGKSAKNVSLKEAAIVNPPSGPTFAFTAGWDSRYVYKGLDVLEVASDPSESTGVWYGRASMEWAGFAMYAGYLQSDSKVTGRVTPDNEYYAETQLGASYTLGLVKDVAVSVGYNAFFFNHSSFVGHDYQGEAFAKVAYTGISWLTPSLLAAYMHADSGSEDAVSLDGWWYEARLDANFPLFTAGNISVSINPFVCLGVDGGYNSAEEESFQPYSMEYGVNIPTRIGDHLIVNLHANFGQDLTGDGDTIPDFWAGASVTYKF